jgi:immunoglobulin-like protein involved in spore germination/sporulation and spore germination protein
MSVAGFAVAGCGGGGSAAETTTSTVTAATTTAPPTTTAPTTTATATTSVRVYFLRDGKVAAARRIVPETRAVGGAALAALAAGPSVAERAAGLTSEVPVHTTFRDLRIHAGVATVTPPSDLSSAGQAQVVYTLAQFPTVRAVELDGRRLTRADLEDETPAILIESPVVGDVISSPVRIYGTANTFEATFLVELLLNAAGQRAFRQVVTATSGSGTRGTFDVSIPFALSASGPGTLVAYEESAENGQPIHRIEIPVTIRG